MSAMDPHNRGISLSDFFKYKNWATRKRKEVVKLPRAEGGRHPNRLLQERVELHPDPQTCSSCPPQLRFSSSWTRDLHYLETHTPFSHLIHGSKTFLSNIKRKISSLYTRIATNASSFATIPHATLVSTDTALRSEIAELQRHNAPPIQCKSDKEESTNFDGPFGVGCHVLDPAEEGVFCEEPESWLDEDELKEDEKKFWDLMDMMYGCEGEAKVKEIGNGYGFCFEKNKVPVVIDLTGDDEDEEGEVKEGEGEGEGEGPAPVSRDNSVIFVASVPANKTGKRKRSLAGEDEEEEVATRPATARSSNNDQKRRRIEKEPPAVVAPKRPRVLLRINYNRSLDEEAPISHSPSEQQKVRDVEVETEGENGSGTSSESDGEEESDSEFEPESGGESEYEE